MTESDIKRWRDYALTVAVNKGIYGHDKEDVAQDALLDLLEGWDKPDCKLNPNGYYSQIVRNRIKMFLRSRNSKPVYDELRDGVEGDAEDDGDTPREQRNDSLSHDPFEAISRAIDAEAEVTALLPELSELSPYQREVIKRTAEGFTTTEIAKQLGRSYWSVESTRRAVRRKLA